MHCSHVHLGRLWSLAYNSSRGHALHLFNAKLKYVRCISSCSVVRFKKELDSYMRNLVDLPSMSGFNNSLDSRDSSQWWTPCDDLAAN